MTVLVSWWACAPPPGSTSEAWEGVEQALVVDAGTVVVDRYSSRRNPDGTIVRTLDRCRWEVRDGALHEARCVVGPPARSTLSRMGGALLDEQIEEPSRARTVQGFDPETLAATWSLSAGLEPEGRIPGGSWFAEGDALLLFANHGMSGVEVAGGDERASFTAERWEGGAVVWRHALLRYPQEAHHVPGTLAVLDQGTWQLVDTKTGASRPAPTPGRPGACLLADSLVYLSAEEPPVRISVPIAGGPPALAPMPTLPGWVGACVSRDDTPWFHGGDDDGNGWLLAPDGAVTKVPRVDLELGGHVDADGALWVVELGRGYVVADPVTLQVTRPPRELHDVVRLGDDLVTYGVDVNLDLWIRSRRAEWSRPHRVSPRAGHVVNGVLWTFAHRLAPGEPLVETLSVPALTPLQRWDDWPAH